MRKEFSNREKLSYTDNNIVCASFEVKTITTSAVDAQVLVSYKGWGLKATAVPCLPCRARSGVPVI